MGKKVLAVLWEWTDESAHKGARFWGCHDPETDGRVEAWSRIGVRALGAAEVVVEEGQGLDLLSRFFTETAALET